MPVDITSTLAQNHVAGIAPMPMQQLAVVCASDQSPLLFAVDENGRLTVTMRDAGQSTGWIQIPLSDQLAGMDGLGGAPLTQCFAASQDTDGGIWLALAVSDGDPLHASRVYTSPKLPANLSPQEWRHFAKLLLLRPTPAGMAFCELVLGNGDDGGGFPGIVAGTFIPMTGYLEQYVINPDPSDTTWTCVPFKMPGGATLCRAAAFGNIPGLGRGIYALCATADPRLDSLTFTTQPVVDEHGEPHWTVRTFDLPVNYAWTVTAALAALPVGGGMTELYVSGAGLHRYPLSLQTGDCVGPPLEIADTTFFGATPRLSVSCDAAASTIDVWALNAYDQLAHTTGYRIGGAPGEDPAYTWDPALTLATEISALAAYRTPVADRVEESSGSPTRGAVAIAYWDHMALMVKSSELQVWQESAVSLQAPDAAFTLNTFTTRITVTDEDHIALGGTPVLLRPSFDVPALVNGKYSALKTGIARLAVTDAGGRVTIVVEAGDLTAPVYEVTVGGRSTQEDPAANLVAGLRTITTPEQISNARRSDGGALFPDPADPEQLMSQCTAAVDGIQGLLIAYDRLESEGARAGRGQARGHRRGLEHSHDARHGRRGHKPRVGHNASLTIGCHFADDGTVTVHKGRAALETLPPPAAWEWLQAIGDGLKAAADGVERAVSWTLDIGEEVISFAIGLGSRVIASVIDVLEQTPAVIAYVLEATVGISLTDILAWLGSGEAMTRTT